MQDHYTPEVQIDPEFKALCPALSSEELSQLEANLKADGCRDALVVWNSLLIDGHNRHALCQKHGLPFAVRELDLPDRRTAKIWIILNQFGRRNLSSFSRGELSVKLKPLLQEQAKERQREGGRVGGMGGKVVAMLPQPSLDVEEPSGSGKTRDALAEAAGISPRTFSKGEVWNGILG